MSIADICAVVAQTQSSCWYGDRQVCRKSLSGFLLKDFSGKLAIIRYHYCYLLIDGQNRQFCKKIFLFVVGALAPKFVVGALAPKFVVGALAP